MLLYHSVRIVLFVYSSTILKINCMCLSIQTSRYEYAYKFTAIGLLIVSL